MSAAERTYKLLLCAYPAAFRATYEREMALLFRDQRRELSSRGIRFWAELIWDVARSAPALRIEALHNRWDRDTQTGEGKMKPMAILAVLVGALVALNALVEGYSGGMVNGDGYSLMWGVLGVVGGVLLSVSGIALLRQARAATAWAGGAAITCLVVFVLMAFVHPRMSVFANLLGIGFPIVLLIFLRRGRGTSGPIMA
jgi:hypothetical protein